MWVEGQIDTVLMFDASHCPSPVPQGYAACMGYAGGSSAAHEWTPDEWARVAHLPRLPVWVPTPGRDNPRQAALAFARRLTELGVPRADQQGGRHVRCLWDMETGTEPDPGWLDIAADVLHARGYFSLSYGSTSWAFGQTRRAGYFPADPTGVPHLYDHDNVVGTQFRWGVLTDGGIIDESLITTDLLPNLWMP